MTRVRRIPRPSWRTLMLAALLALLPAGALAQAGGIRGTVTGAAGEGLRGARVAVAGTRWAATTGAGGAYALPDVAPGTYTVRATYPGHKAAESSVTVGGDGAATADFRLEEAPMALDAMVVSASRQAQRITDAPATITRIGPEVLENVVGNSFVGALKMAKGLDFIQVGATSVAVNARGFNSSFNNRMLMMEDGRIAVLPENGLPAGQMTAIPKIDLAGLEVIVGPGAALYGADASNGVLTLTTKDPRDYPGTTVEVTGGTRAYRDVQLRHAGVLGAYGYKVAGEWQQADEWSNRLRYGAGGAFAEQGVGGRVDWGASVGRVTGSVIRYFNQSQLELSAGTSQTNGVGQTNVGRNQLVDWRYGYAQARYTSPRFFVNLYRTSSNAGDSYALNRYTEFRNAATNAGRSDEDVRLMSDWPSSGQLYAAEVQNNFTLPQLLNTRVVWGAQVRHDRVSSDEQWLTDRLTGEPLTIDQRGVYAQTETQVMPWLTLLLAGRYDTHEKYDAQFSPKAGLLFRPAPGQTFRVTYNRAFKSPTTLQTDFYIPDFVPTVGVFGNTDGFEVRRADDSVIATYKPLVPEENQTWEAGYKGVLGERFFVDVTGYTSKYRDFLSPLATIAFPALGSFAYRNGQRVVNETGGNQAVLTYFNLGTARLNGVDAGLDFVASRKLTLSATASYADLESIDRIDIKTVLGTPDTARIREASSLNAPELKWTLGANANDVGNFLGGLTLRHVDEYFFASGINKGTIAGFTTLDLNVGYRIPRFNNALLNVGVTNLFTCHGNDVSQPEEGSGCGFGAKHTEMINMPPLGTMLTVGLRYQVR